MKTTCFTHPNASELARIDCSMAVEILDDKKYAILANGRTVKIEEKFFKTMYSQEASQFEVRNSDGVIAFFANGQFWDACSKRIVRFE